MTTISLALDTIQSTPLLQRTLEELCEQEEGLLVGMLILQQYKAAKDKPVRGCVWGGYPSISCVFDTGRKTECSYARQLVDRKENCEYWKPIVKGGANGR